MNTQQTPTLQSQLTPEQNRQYDWLKQERANAYAEIAVLQDVIKSHTDHIKLYNQAIATILSDAQVKDYDTRSLQ
jgi:hypothetical protein